MRTITGFSEGKRHLKGASKIECIFLARGLQEGDRVRLLVAHKRFDAWETLSCPLLDIVTEDFECHRSP
jgi:hypothetical protein